MSIRHLIATVILILGLAGARAASPQHFSVEVLTNGTIYRPTNFWLMNSTSIVNAITSQFDTNPVAYSFSADFVVTSVTNVALAASNLQGQIDNKTSTNTFWTGSNYLATNFTAQLGSASNSLFTNWVAQLGIGTNNLGTNLLTSMTNVLSLYNSNVLGGFVMTNITLGTGVLANVAHNLTTPPRFVACVIECQSADNGYVEGDRIAIDGVESTSDERALVVGVNTTNVFLIQRSVTVMKTINKSTGANDALDPTKWKAAIFAGQ